MVVKPKPHPTYWQLEKSLNLGKIYK